MKHFRPEPRKVKSKPLRKKQALQLIRNERERAQMEESNPKVRITFVNVGLGKQTTARNFWVILNREMLIEEIMRRVEKAFGDLEAS